MPIVWWSRKNKGAEMSNVNPENIALVITAIAGLVTAIGALVHSKNTRKGIAENEVANMEKESK